MEVLTTNIDIYSKEVVSTEVVEYSNVLESITSTYFSYPETTDRDKWNLTLQKITDNQKNIKNYIVALSKSIEKIAISNDYEELLVMTFNTYNLYIDEMKKNKKNEYKEPSIESLYQLVRFMPEYPKKKLLNIYLDEMTGAFGVIIKSQKKGNPILNVLMKDNKEIIFSLIKKNNAIIKISGRAYFNDDLGDSAEINKIFSMI